MQKDAQVFVQLEVEPMAQIQDYFELQLSFFLQLIRGRVEQDHESNCAQCEKVDKVA